MLQTKSTPLAFDMSFFLEDTSRIGLALLDPTNQTILQRLEWSLANDALIGATPCYLVARSNHVELIEALLHMLNCPQIPTGLLEREDLALQLLRRRCPGLVLDYAERLELASIRFLNRVQLVPLVLIGRSERLLDNLENELDLCRRIRVIGLKNRLSD